MIIIRLCNSLKTSFRNPLSYNLVFNRYKSGNSQQNLSADRKLKLRSTLYYVTAAGVLAVGLSYAAVPLYRMFCQVRY